MSLMGRTMRWLAVFGSVILLSNHSSATEGLSEIDVLIKNVTLYDGMHENPVLTNVVIKDGRFTAIGSDVNANGEAVTIIDGSNKFMIPGLWDMHTHIRSSSERGLVPEDFLASGVTSIRDLGGYKERIKSVEAGLAHGELVGPSIYPSYFVLNGQSFAGFQRSVTNEQEITASLDELVRLGASQVKVHRALSPDLLPFLVKGAHDRGLKVTGHIPLGVHPLAACHLGLDGIEHIGSFVEAFNAIAEEGHAGSQASIDFMLSDQAEPLYKCLSDNRTSVTATLVIYPAIARQRAGTEEIPQAFVNFIEDVQKITKKMHDAGILLVTGTDTSDLLEPAWYQPGVSLLDELDMHEQAGIPAASILKMATFNAAEALGAGVNSGYIAPGKDADFVLLASDPGQTTQNFRSIESVYIKGKNVFSAT